MHWVRIRTVRLLVAAAVSLSCTALSMAQQQPATVSQTVNGQTTTIMTDGSGKAVMTLPDGSVQTFDMPKGAGANVDGTGGVRLAVPGKAIDLSQIRQNVLDQLKTAMGCSDEEWAVILPKLEKVEAAEFEAGAPASGVGPAAKLAVLSGASSQKPSVVSQRRQELRTTLQNPSASEAEVKQRIESLREARTQARERLAQARKELADVLTQRQEAVLIDRGILE